jgi:hypothetical protein
MEYYYGFFSFNFSALSPDEDKVCLHAVINLSSIYITDNDSTLIGNSERLKRFGSIFYDSLVFKVANFCPLLTHMME